MEKIYSKQKNRKKKTSFLKISLLTDLSYLSHSPFLTFLERRKLATRRGREKRLEEGHWIPQPLNDRRHRLDSPQWAKKLLVEGERKEQIYQSAPIHGNKMKFCPQGRNARTTSILHASMFPGGIHSFVDR